MLSIFSPLRIMFAVGLPYMAFIMLRYVPFMTAFWRVFYHRWMLNFVKGFLRIYWDNHKVFIFQFVNVVYHIDWLANIEEFYSPLILLVFTQIIFTSNSWRGWFLFFWFNKLMNSFSCLHLSWSHLISMSQKNKDPVLRIFMAKILTSHSWYLL